MNRAALVRISIFATMLLWGLGYIVWFGYLVQHSRDFIVTARRSAVCKAAGQHPETIAHDLVFDTAHADRNMLAAGWSEAESWGVWSDGKRSRLILPVPPEVRVQGGTLALQLLVPSNPEVPRLPTHVSRADEEIAYWMLGEQGNDDVRELQFSAAQLQGQSCVELAFAYERAYRPLKAGLGDDARLLGMGLKRVRWQPTDTLSPR